MHGILAYGAYVPFARLDRKEIAGVLGGRAGKGERAVANYDEDAVTMAVGAARNAIGPCTGADLGALYFATTTSPYREKLSATTIAGALDAGDSVRTAEFADSLRGGTTALLAGLDAAAQGTAVLVTAADCRVGGPSGANESSFGDGAASFVLGTGGEHAGVLAKPLGAASVAREIVEVFRGHDDPFTRNWEERFGLTQGYVPSVTEAAKRACEAAGVAVGDVTRVVLDGPTPRAQLAAAKAMGVAPDRIVPMPVETVGHTGTANAPMMLVAALEAASPGDTILVVDYAEGADALVLEVTDAIARFTPTRTTEEQVATKRNIGYGSLLRWRELVAMEPPRRPDIARPSAPAMRRNAGQNLALTGSRCRQCATAMYPAQRVCWKCRAKDEMEPYGFRDRSARLSTFTADNLTVSPDPPEIAAVLDFEGGGRMIANVTDVDYRALAVGDEMEMTFRRLYEAGGIHNYFWKATQKRA